MSDELFPVGGAGDPFATLPATPPTEGGGAGGAPSAGGDPATPPQYVSIEKFNQVQGELEKLKPLESLRWAADALQDPQTRNNLMRAIAGGGAGAAPSYSQPPAIIDPTEAIKARYQPLMAQKVAEGDFVGAQMLGADLAAEMAEARGRINLEAAAAPVLNLNAQTAIEGFYANKRNDPRTAAIFSKLEPKLREFIQRTSPADVAKMVANGSLMSNLEGAFKIVLADSYIESYGAAAAAGKLGPGAAQNPPPYSAGTRGGAPPILPGDQLPDDAADSSGMTDKQFLEFMAKQGMNVKITGNASGSSLISELQ